MQNWDEKTLQNLTEQAIQASGADHTVASINGHQRGVTRFANSEINQNVVESDLVLGIEVAFGSKVGRASTNRVTKEAITACVKRAEQIARLSPQDPEYMPPVSPVGVPKVDMWHAASANISASDRAKVVSHAVGLAEKSGAEGAGSYRTGATVTALGNSAGHFCYHRSTEAVLKFSATKAGSIGSATETAFDATKLHVDAAAKRAIQKAIDGQNPRELPPGRYDVILEPAATAGLTTMASWVQADAKSTDEGQTFFSGKLGTSIVSPMVNIFSDPTYTTCPGRPFDSEGMRLGRVDWIRAGVLENLRYSRFWAKKKGKTPTGEPSNLVIQGGKSSVDDMIKSTQRGLLITRFWYIRIVDRMRDLYTGTTRDGTFLVEDGKVVAPVKNLRFNESAMGMLKNVELLGEERTIPFWGRFVRAPFLKARNFNFTSATKF